MCCIRSGCGALGLLGCLAGSAVSPAAMAAGAASEPAAPAAAQITAIRTEIEALRTEYEARLRELERRLAALEADTEAAEDAASADLEDLRAAAREAAGLTGPEAGPAAASAQPAAATVGRERDLSRLNPEISFTGIFRADASDVDREEFRLGEFELDLQAALDPFSRTRWTVAFDDGEAEIEEGYVLFNALGHGQTLLAGRFRQRFGALNRQHLHALPQSDYPPVLRAYFGDGGLAQTGVSWSWLPRRSIASANELTLELTDGENETAFGGESFEDLALLAHLKSFWDLGDAAYFEWGLSGIGGETADGGDSRVWGTDLTYHWQPPQRAKYRDLTWRTELLLSQRDDELGRRREAWGAYTYVEGLARRNLYLGLRLDRFEDPLDPDRRLRGLAPYLTWWQSEYVRIRAEYGYLEDELSGDEENRFTLQLTWAAGPHKHETY